MFRVEASNCGFDSVMQVFVAVQNSQVESDQPNQPSNARHQAFVVSNDGRQRLRPRAVDCAVHEALLASHEQNRIIDRVLARKELDELPSYPLAEAITCLADVARAIDAIHLDAPKVYTALGRDRVGEEAATSAIINCGEWTGEMEPPHDCFGRVPAASRAS